MATRVIHIRDAPSDFKTNPKYVYIGRGSKWGNPHKMRRCPAQLSTRLPEDIARKLLAKIQELWAIRERTRVIHSYASYLQYNDKLQAALPELQDKILVCYCHPKHCHGDILVSAVRNLQFRQPKPDLDDVDAWLEARLPKAG